MARHGRLDFPVVGVAKSDWSTPQLVERARASVNEFGGGEDKNVFPQARRGAPLRYRADCADSGTYFAAESRDRGTPTPAPLPRHPTQCVPCRDQAARRVELRRGRARRARKALRAGSLGRRRSSTNACTRSFPRTRSSGSITTSAKNPCRTFCTSSDTRTRSSIRFGTAAISRTCKSQWPNLSASKDAASSTRRPASSAT